MNVHLIKNIGFAASGALIGALGAYYATKRVLEKEFEESLENETKSLKEHLSKMSDVADRLAERMRIYEDAGLSYETACAIADKNRRKNAQASEDLKEKVILEQGYTSYSKNFTAKDGKEKISETKEGETAENPEVIDLTKDESDEDQHPYLISNESFADDHEEYRKVSCTFYTEDKVLCESAHNEKIDIQSVGKENLEFFEANDLDLLYVRNDYLGIDYEIDKYEGNYTYEVLGEESLEED